MTDKPEAQKDAAEENPAKKAAWEGYRQYKEDMAQRSHVPTVRDLNMKTLIIIGVVIILMLMAKDAADYVREAMGWT